MHDGFMYNSRYDYESNNLLNIGRMSNVCLKCSHRNVFHALDKTLQDLRGSSAIMGGATVVLAGQFANKLLQIGDGKVPEDPSTGLNIMPCGQIVNFPDELLSKVYSNIQQNFKDQDWLSHRLVLASRNDVVEKLNIPFRSSFQGKNMPTSP
ncbi:ATP-dependent DNA helicase [Trichonephila clavata]|uniref:ATP-dependent DNA helicase n=1 Tax=Trichonephila clavata TaxID=2740835 RepID=A0A8X6KNN0_TRICU|nr:ATP-dependent DNA helicase [Trichonephila clavata]